MPGRKGGGSVGARFREHALTLNDLLEDCKHFREMFLHETSRAPNIVRESLLQDSLITNGRKNSNAICFGTPHSSNFNFGPTTMTERPE